MLSIIDIKPIIEEAIAISDDINLAITSGETSKAKDLVEKQLSLLQNIPFSKLTHEQVLELTSPLSSLLNTHENLTDTTSSIKETMGDELQKVKKSISGAQAYHDIHNS